MKKVVSWTDAHTPVGPVINKLKNREIPMLVYNNDAYDAQQLSLVLIN